MCTLSRSVIEASLSSAPHVFLGGHAYHHMPSKAFELSYLYFH